MMDSCIPRTEPYEHGLLPVDDGHVVYWETCGDANGKPAVVLHGGPGSGCTPWHRRLFDPDVYRIVVFDQRGCGRSRPHASDPNADLSANTTIHLLVDIERLREHLGVERWLVWGGSWGSVLALAYAEAHPERVTELVLWGVATGRRAEFDYMFRGGVGATFTHEWSRLVEAVPARLRELDVVDAYAELLFDPDPEVRARAACEWCLIESVSAERPRVGDAPQYELATRFREPGYALAFARLVTHYVKHNAWIEDGQLLRDADRIASISTVIVHGALDMTPLEWSIELHRALSSSELVVVNDAGQDPHAPGITDALVRATDQFASSPS